MKLSFSVLVMFLLFAAHSWGGERFNFNAGWKVQMGKNPKASGTKFDDSQWQTVTLPCDLSRGETPATPAYKVVFRGVAVKAVEVGSKKEHAAEMYDDDEKSVWKSDGRLENAWATFHLERAAAIKQVSLRLLDFRKTSYPLEITTADGTVVWTGYTPKGLGNVYLTIDNPVKSDTYKIRMLGPATVKEAFASMTELAAKKNVSTKAGKSTTLSIIEVGFNEEK